MIVNQAVNYLTVDLANAFAKTTLDVGLIAGSVHIQGDSLSPSIRLAKINKLAERPASRKILSWFIAIIRIWWLLLTKFRTYEVIFISVPPMAYLLSVLIPNRSSMLIWDVYPDALKAAGKSERSLIYRTWARLNRACFKRAHRIMTISDTLATALNKYTDKKIVVHPIWAVLTPESRISSERNHFLDQHKLRGKFVVQYSGNIGQTHNVEFLIDVAERLLYRDDIIFQVIGRGPRLPDITALVKTKGLSNVQLLPFQSDDMFPYSLSAASLGVVVLDERVSQGSVPSKAFNLMSIGTPSLYVSSPDSQLAEYALRFGHASCFSAREHSKITEFILKVADDPAFASELSRNAVEASKHFCASNADLFVQGYFD